MTPSPKVDVEHAKAHFQEAVKACGYYDAELRRVDTWLNRTFMPWRVRHVRDLVDLWNVARYDRATMCIAGGEHDTLSALALRIAAIIGPDCAVEINKAADGSANIAMSNSDRVAYK